MGFIKIRQLWTLSLQLVGSQQDIGRVIVTKVVDSVVGFSPSQPCERVDKQANEFVGRLINLAMCSNRMS